MPQEPHIPCSQIAVESCNPAPWPELEASFAARSSRSSLLETKPGQPALGLVRQEAATPAWHLRCGRQVCHHALQGGYPTGQERFPPISRIRTPHRREPPAGKPQKAGLGKQAQRSFRRQLPILLDVTDRPVENCEGRDELWLRHFGKQEFGVSKTVEQLIQQQHPPPPFSRMWSLTGRLVICRHCWKSRLYYERPPQQQSCRPWRSPW